MGNPILVGFKRITDTVAGLIARDTSGNEFTICDTDGYLYQNDTKVTETASNINAVGDLITEVHTARGGEVDLNTRLGGVDTQLAQKAPLASPTFTGLITTAGQIKFPVTQSASSDPNTLDDYEEGTFTPDVIGTLTPGIGTYTYQSGKYCKIGNLVYVSIRLGWSAHTGTGNIGVSNLPFSSSPDSDHRTAFAVGMADALALTASRIPLAYLGVNLNYVNIFQLPVGGGALEFVPIDSAVNSLVISGCYQIS